MHLYQLEKSQAAVKHGSADRSEVSKYTQIWNQLEPCQFSCGGKIVRSGECSNHCPPSREMQTGASEAFSDLSGFSEAYPIYKPGPETFGYSRWKEPKRRPWPFLLRTA